MSRSDRAGYLLAATPVFLLAAALYTRTLLPDVGTWDTAEFQAIGPVLGIAHPTGYPTYTMLAWLAWTLTPTSKFEYSIRLPVAQPDSWTA